MSRKVQIGSVVFFQINLSCRLRKKFVECGEQLYLFQQNMCMLPVLPVQGCLSLLQQVK